MRLPWPVATLLRSQYLKGPPFCSNLFMPGLNHVRVLEESEADTRRECGHEPSPNDGRRDGVNSDTRLETAGQEWTCAVWFKSDPREEANCG